MRYQVLALPDHRNVEDAEKVWVGDTFEEACDKARWWLKEQGKPGEVVAQIWNQDRHRLRLTLRMDAFGQIEERPNPGIVWTKNAPAGGWRYVAYVLAPARGSTYEWLVVRFPRVGTVMGEDVAWGLADSQQEAEEQATRALDEAVKRASQA